MPVPVQLRAWHAHLAKVRAKHPNMKPTDVAKLASKSYKSKSKKGGNMSMINKPVTQKQLTAMILKNHGIKN